MCLLGIVEDLLRPILTGSKRGDHPILHSEQFRRSSVRDLDCVYYGAIGHTLESDVEARGPGSQTALPRLR